MGEVTEPEVDWLLAAPDDDGTAADGGAGAWLVAGAGDCELEALGVVDPPVVVAPELPFPDRCERSALRCGRIGLDGCKAAAAGASPVVTDSGSDESPIRWSARRLADHAIAALTAIPSTATAIHITVRRIMRWASYSARG